MEEKEKNKKLSLIAVQIVAASNAIKKLNEEGVEDYKKMNALNILQSYQEQFRQESKRCGPNTIGINCGGVFYIVDKKNVMKSKHKPSIDESKGYKHNELKMIMLAKRLGPIDWHSFEPKEIPYD